MNKRKAFSLPICLLLMAVSLQAQNQLSGTVQDITTQIPIEFAHLFFLNQQHTGVITNQVGQFSLQVPENMKGDTIVISQIGYHHYYLPLINLEKDQKEIQIKLSPNQFILEEAVIIAEAGLKTIVQRAIDRIPQNYPTEKHRLKAYYREYSITDSVYTHLTESFVTIQDESYIQSKTCDIFVHELRKSNDDRDSLLPRTFLRPGKNELLATYEAIFTSVARSRLTFFEKNSKQFIEKTKFQYLGQTIMDTDTLIHIGYNPYWGRVRRSNGSDDFVILGELVINRKDYAVVKHRIGFNRSDTFWEIQYRKTNEKYYPSLIVNLFSISLRDKTIAYSNSRMYHFYLVEPDMKNFQPLGSRRRIVEDQSIQDMKYVYLPEFWETNTILLEVRANTALEKDMNRKQSLQDQFKENARRVKTVNEN